MSATTVTARPPQISALTTMRGLAVWWVVLYHFREYLPVPYHTAAGGFIAQAYYGLDFFFVLSGFVLQINYAPGMARLTRQNLRSFAIARFGRIYPLHLFMMLVYPLIPLAILFFSSQGNLGGRYPLEYYVLSLLLLQNWGITTYLSWNVPAWSISTEFASYLCFPFAAVLVMRLRGVVASLAAMAVVLAAIAAMFIWAGVTLRYDTVRFGLPRCVLEFFVGMCVGRIYQLRGAPGLGMAMALLVASVALVVAVLREWVTDYYVLPAAYAAMILALSCPRGVVTRVLCWRWLVYLGEISYATYLSHYFIREVIKFALPGSGGAHWVGSITFLVATLIASVVLYHFVELPSRSYFRRLGSMRPVSAGGRMHEGSGLVAVRESNRRDSGA
jgi:peptidoglycan/LPS O-acetylase OafA/YrhL